MAPRTADRSATRWQKIIFEGIKRLYTALSPVLACLQGAIKLAEGTVLQHSLDDAFALLDAAQTRLIR
jgi:hypothetical protein